MKRILFILLLSALGACAASAQSKGHVADRIPVMILDGQSAGAYHNWRLTTPVLKTELEETRRQAESSSPSLLGVRPRSQLVWLQPLPQL